ncbi:MAG: hypothetical protein NTZ16_00345 [Verrucomicrobia bacterium]|nr:hypothetical protein [Verrucomicrobiota bacterium]
MFRKVPRVNPLQSRKYLLVAESELNRAQLVGDMTALTADVRALAVRAQSFGSIASSAAGLLAGLAAFRRDKPATAAAKPSWLKNILKGAGLVSTLWLAFRPQSRNRNEV